MAAAGALAGSLAAALWLAPAPARAQGAAAPAAAGPASLHGTVRDSGDVPLREVTVAADGGASVSTDAEGAFRLDGLAAGRQAFVARRVGYAPARFEVALPPGGTARVALRLGRAATVLGTVVVDGRALDDGLLAEGFYDRRRTALGQFISPERVAGRRMSQASAFFRDVPSVSVRRGGLGQTVLMARGSRGDCALDVWVDGYYTPLLASISFDDVVNMDRVKAAEVYRAPREVPPRFQRPGSDCGAVVVWTSAPDDP
jgi:hypothetical protein